MNDPHVEEMSYFLVSVNPNDKFDETAPLEQSTDNFDFKLDKGVLTVKPKAHFSTFDEARKIFEPFLHDWEAAAFLSPGRYRLRFDFKDGRLIDLNPDPNNVTVALGTAHCMVVSENITVTRSNPQYPAPTVNVKTSPLLDDLIYRVQRYLDGKEQLPSVAYLVLDRLEQDFSTGKDKRRALANSLNIDFDVLNKLGELSSKRDKIIGRKGGNMNQPISDLEQRWMKDVVFQLMNRVGEINAGMTQLKYLTLADFPDLDN